MTVFINIFGNDETFWYDKTSYYKTKLIRTN